MNQSERHRLHSWLEWIFCLDEVIPWYTGYVYKGHTLSVRDDGCLLVLRLSKGRDRFVSFYGGWKPVDCWQALATALRTGKMSVSLDKYAP
jgi:hypothetical protein